MFSLTQQQLAHFQAFGFVVLPRLVRDLVTDTVELGHEAYHLQRWPAWREWVAGARTSRSRQVAVERLRLLGVVDAGDPR